MSNANFITRFEFKLNNLTGSELESELNALRATADLHPSLNLAAVALLDAAIDGHAQNLTNSSSIEELVIVGNACAEKRSTVKGTQRGVSPAGLVAISEVNMQKASARLLSTYSAYAYKQGSGIINAVTNSLHAYVELVDSTTLRVVGDTCSWEIKEDV